MSFDPGPLIVWLSAPPISLSPLLSPLSLVLKIQQCSQNGYLALGQNIPENLNTFLNSSAAHSCPIVKAFSIGFLIKW